MFICISYHLLYDKTKNLKQRTLQISLHGGQMIEPLISKYFPLRLKSMYLPLIGQTSSLFSRIKINPSISEHICYVREK